MSEMTGCSFCGNTEEYYIKTYFYGSVHMRQRFDGGQPYNCDWYDALRIKPGKYAYCVECHKRLFKVEGE